MKEHSTGSLYYNPSYLPNIRECKSDPRLRWKSPFIRQQCEELVLGNEPWYSVLKADVVAAKTMHNKTSTNTIVVMSVETGQMIHTDIRIGWLYPY